MVKKMKWKVKIPHLNQDNLVDEIYRARGIDDFQMLFSLDETNLHDPYMIKDMDKAVRRIKNAIDKKEKILIYGDYDVDGITSTYLLTSVLRELKAFVQYDIPNRLRDGYGLSKAKVFDIINDDYQLVITVDNGIKSVEEAALFSTSGIDLIITDHHELPSNMPKSFVTLHTELSNYPFKELAGVGVAFKLAQALIGDEALEYIDIVALGTVADMMPLFDENRAIVNLGLEKMAQTQNEGLRNLLSHLEIFTPSVADIQYRIAPRLNACGRMGNAKLAVSLLEATNSLRAIQLIQDIEEINTKRRKLTEKLFDEALYLMNNTEPSIVVCSPKMHEGVVGIIASRLASEFGKVSVVLKEDEFTFHGSARSYNGVDVLQLLRGVSDLLVRFGGHQSAAGLELKIEDFDEFITRFNALIPKANIVKEPIAEGIIDINKLSFEQIHDLEHYDLKDSRFVFPKLRFDNRYLIKGEHTKLIIAPDIEAIFFNNKTLYTKLNRPVQVSLLGRVDVSMYRGKKKKQIIIDDYEI